LRVYGRAGAGARPQAMWRRPLARERHEARGEHQESLAAAAPAGHQSQHGSDGLLPDRAGAAREVRRGALGALRRDLRRRQEVVCSAPPGYRGGRYRFLSTFARKSRTTRFHASGWSRFAKWLAGERTTSFEPRIFRWITLIAASDGSRSPQRRRPRSWSCG